MLFKKTPFLAKFGLTVAVANSKLLLAKLGACVLMYVLKFENSSTAPIHEHKWILPVRSSCERGGWENNQTHTTT